MDTSLRILHLEDDPGDAAIVLDVLEAGGIVCEITRVETGPEFSAALDTGVFDLILADFSLPSFDGLSALEIARERAPELPFIFVSGNLGEERAIDALKVGATDYVLKERLARIVTSVRRAVREARERAERKQAGEELRRLESRLQQAQRFEAMGALAGGIAHDFNNILGAILGYGERALRDAQKGTRLRRDLESIMAAGERGRALVDRVLAFSRGSAGERVPVHVEKVVREALDVLEGKLPAGIQIRATLLAGRAAMLGDPTQVHQIVLNLGMNAIQAMPAGGTLSVSLETVRFDAPRSTTIGGVGAGECLVLRVADTGTGIPTEILHRIFDPFFTTKEAGVGTGLGLSLVLRLVTEAGGAIDVASTPGVGSMFTVYLPRVGDAEDSPKNEEPAVRRGDGQRVMVVDDEEPLVRLASSTLEELGYAPVAFTSGVAALDAFRADPDGFDAVITDERMPGLTGLELIRHIRGMRSSIPILLVSGYTGASVTDPVLEEGVAEVLRKPLSAQALGANLARVLRLA